MKTHAHNGQAQPCPTCQPSPKVNNFVQNGTEDDSSVYDRMNADVSLHEESNELLFLVICAF